MTNTTAWRKSSYSCGSGGDCVEVGQLRKSSYSGGEGGGWVEVAPWRKSSYSGGQGGSCVEVAHETQMILVRDTTDRDGGTLTFPATAWSAFAASLES